MTPLGALQTLKGTRKYRHEKENHLVLIDIDCLNECVDAIEKKLGELEDIEEKLNLWTLEENQRSLTVFLRLILAEEKGFYYKKDNEIYFCRWCVRVGFQLVEVHPCYAVKETTLESCYYGDVEQIKEVEDAHYWSWKTCLNVHLRDYGKTWALTREELL